MYEELVKIGLSGPRMVMGLNDGGLQPIELFEKMAETILNALQLDAFNGRMFLLMAPRNALQRRAGGREGAAPGF